MTFVDRLIDYLYICTKGHPFSTYAKKSKIDSLPRPCTQNEMKTPKQ